MGDKEEKLIYAFKKKTSVVNDSESSSESEPEKEDTRNKSVPHNQDWRGKDDFIKTGASASKWRDLNNVPSNQVWRRRDNSTTPGSSATDWSNTNSKREDSKESGEKQCSNRSWQERRQDSVSPSDSNKKNSRGERGRSDCNWRKPNEKYFRRERDSNNSRSVVESFRGNWTLRGDIETMDGYGKTEADRIWNSLNELHEENPVLFPFPPDMFRYGATPVRTINCNTRDYRDVENIRDVARAIRNRIYYPCVMYYFKHKLNKAILMYTLEEELYESDDCAWKLVKERA